VQHREEQQSIVVYRHLTTMLQPIGIPSLLWKLSLFIQTVVALPTTLPTTNRTLPTTSGHSVNARDCPDFSSWSQDLHEPFSTGKYNLSYQRPITECRTFHSQDVESAIQKMKGVIKDPDLFRLFENSYPNTLDTAIRWKGVVENTDEELTFIITGDIDAMWLRDSANQMQSYLPLLKASSDKKSIASLYRGVINLQARYLVLAPYCNSFQPPSSANITLVINSGSTADSVNPFPDPKFVWECKYELDSLASFLQVSSEYYQATKDTAFFAKYSWVQAVQSVLKTAQDMSQGTYGADGQVLPSAYTFQRQTTRATETLANDGKGNPVGSGTGLIRSAFRPSDDATIYQLFIPANMMFARYLDSAADIMVQIPGQSSLGQQMKSYAKTLRDAVMQHGTVNHPKYGKIFAYEVDGFGSANSMDDANIPSLLSAPHLGFVSANDTVYQNTRRFILSDSNPYFMRGPEISSIGGPHVGPGMAWPMASIVKILTSNDDQEISQTLKEILSTTNNLGLIHESINTFDQSRWTRQW
jgi:uncharacterized protein